jgi:hypothetical protein
VTAIQDVRRGSAGRSTHAQSRQIRARGVQCEIPAESESRCGGAGARRTVRKKRHNYCGGCGRAIASIFCGGFENNDCRWIAAFSGTSPGTSLVIAATHARLRLSFYSGMWRGLRGCEGCDCGTNGTLSFVVVWWRSATKHAACRNLSSGSRGVVARGANLRRFPMVTPSRQYMSHAPAPRIATPFDTCEQHLYASATCPTPIPAAAP